MNKAYFHNAFRKNLLIILICTAIFVFSVDFGYSQEKKRVDILQAGSLIQSKDIANAKRLIDDVILKHEDILIYCDSAYKYDNSNRVDAFGNVHINQADTLHLYADKIYYNGNISFASAIKNVRLVNKTATLYTDTLDYNLETKIAYYDDVFDKQGWKRRIICIGVEHNFNEEYRAKLRALLTEYHYTYITTLGVDDMYVHTIYDVLCS